MLTDKVQEAVAYIHSKTGLRPEIAVVLGSGLGQLGERLEAPCVIPYREIPHFPLSTAPGHQGRMLIGTLAGKNVLCMQGRMHYYEGYTMQQATFYVRVLAKLGIRQLLLSNAAGGINTDFAVGELMLITDHINFMGSNPLLGPNEGDFGVRFPDMTFGYDRRLQAAARAAAQTVGCTLREGVYVACTGPSYETPAEIRMFRQWGADAVGMSTVPEVIVANHCGLAVMAISCITNMAAGVLDQPLTEEEVLLTGAQSGAVFQQLMMEIIRGL